MQIIYVRYCLKLLISIRVVQKNLRLVHVIVPVNMRILVANFLLIYI